MSQARKPIQISPELSARSARMRQALASLRLEGIELTPETLADIALLDSGKMSKEEFLKKTLKIAKS